MPTAVERSFLALLKYDDTFTNDFLKFEPFNAFLKIGGDLSLLAGANADIFQKISHDHKIQQDVTAVGDFFYKEGAALTQGAETALKIVDAFIKITGVGDTIGSATTGAGAGKAGSGLLDAFLKLDNAVATSGADLKIMAADFLKLDQALNAEDLKLDFRVLGDDFLKLGADFKVDQSLSSLLGGDFLKIVDAGGKSPLDLHYKEFGAYLQKVSPEFGSLANDFVKLDNVFGGDGGVSFADGSVLKADFLSLEHDFLKLDHGLSHVVGSAVPELIGLLHAGSHGILIGL